MIFLQMKTLRHSIDDLFFYPLQGRECGNVSTWWRVKTAARKACEEKRAEEDLWSRGKGRAPKESR